MTTTSVGRHAEDAASDYLKSKGYEIIEQNWRTKRCEIDIIAKKQNSIFFVEVKYRKQTDWGGGIEYITPKKLNQMRFSAELWVGMNNWTGDYNLLAIEVSGKDYEITCFLKDL